MKKVLKQTIRFYITTLILFLIMVLPLSAQHEPVLAVMYFDSPKADTEFSFIQKALNEMLVVDLSRIEGLELVERENLDSIMKEFEFGLSGFVDEDTAPEVGQILGAEHMITGSVFFLPHEILVSFKLLKTETGKILSAGRARAPKDKFLLLQNRISKKIQQSLKESFPSIALPNVREKKEAPVTIKDIATFGRALDSKDNRNYSEAAELLEGLTKSVPEMEYASQELSEIKKRIARYDVQRKEHLKDRNKEDVSWNLFMKTLLSYSSAMEFNALLEYCENMSKAVPQAPPSSIQSGKEMVLYNKAYALHSLGRVHEAIEVSEQFLKQYPSSLYYQSVKTFLNQDIQKLEKKKEIESGHDKRTQELQKKIAEAATESERQYNQFLIAEYLQNNNLYKESLRHLKGLDIEVLEERNVSGDRVLFLLYYAYYNLKQRKNAEDVLAKTKQLYPDSHYLQSMESMTLWLGD